MYFNMKNTLKNNCNRTPKETFYLIQLIMR